MFGDYHGSNGILNEITNLLPELKNNGVDTLFLEMVDSKDQDVLKQFYLDGNKTKLKDYFENNGWGNKNEGWVDNLVELIEVAKNNDINVIGIDTKHTGNTRLETSNPHWANVINNHLSNQPSDEKYIVFGGNGHSADFKFNKGVDSRLGIPSIDFIDENLTREKGSLTYNENRGNSDFVYSL